MQMIRSISSRLTGAKDEAKDGSRGGGRSVSQEDGSSVSQEGGGSASPVRAPPSPSEVSAPPSPPVRSTSYALADEEYTEWMRAVAACKRDPESCLENVRKLSTKPKLLNWRNPVSGQTLLHELVASDASESAVAEAVKLGCECSLANADGETPAALAIRKSRVGACNALSVGGPRSSGYAGSRRSAAARDNGGSSMASSTRSTRGLPLTASRGSLRRGGPPVSEELEESAPRRSRASRSSLMAALAPTADASLPPPVMPQQSLSSAGGSFASASSRRKEGRKLALDEVASVPKARINLDLAVRQEATLDRDKLERSIKSVYGAKARVQIDEIAEEEDAEDAVAMEASPSSGVARRVGGGGGGGSSSGGAATSKSRVQRATCRVIFDDASEARSWRDRSCASAAAIGNSSNALELSAQGKPPQPAAQSTSLALQNALASEFQLEAGAVGFDTETMDRVEEVDGITLKLDSDSAHILCGACLLYNGRGECEKVVCHSDRVYGSAVRHSGDTRVDGKSVHTIGVELSKVPQEVTQMYLTLCSCGPSDLSGFKNPSIMLYDNGQPDANLLEYSINQAAKSVSCVMARMQRQPVWTLGDRAVIAHILRRLRMPLLCIDLCVAMGEESEWSIQALGSSEWNMSEKICGNYPIGKRLIEKRLRSGTSAGASGAQSQPVGARARGAAGAAAAGATAAAGAAPAAAAGGAAAAGAAADAGGAGS